MYLSLNTIHQGDALSPLYTETCSYELCTGIRRFVGLYLIATHYVIWIYESTKWRAIREKGHSDICVLCRLGSACTIHAG